MVYCGTSAKEAFVLTPFGSCQNDTCKTAWTCSTSPCPAGSARLEFRRGTNGVSTNRVIAFVCVFWRRDLLGTPVNLLWSSQKCQGVPYSPICQIHDVCSGVISVDPICPQTHVCVCVFATCAVCMCVCVCAHSVCVCVCVSVGSLATVSERACAMWSCATGHAQQYQ